LNILTRSIVRHAHAIARESSARAVLLSADVLQEEQDLAGLIEDVGFRVILVTRRVEVKVPEGWGEYCQVVKMPDVSMTRAGQIKVATLVAAAEGLIAQGDRIVCVTGLDHSGTMDTVMVLDLGHEMEMFGGSTAEPLPTGVEPAVFQRLLTLASELGLEGREGRPVGTLFVVGDHEAVLAQSRQLVMNPFRGYPEDERNVLDTRLEETIKEFSAIDGAFVVRGDGVLLSAGRYLVPVAKLDEPLPQGLGTRHESAAAVTVATEAMALCVSQSTGTVSIFRRGRLIADISKPRGGSGDGL
jgi:DNA integrity scanning protein DisA with diadenylate cyclase activity